MLIRKFKSLKKPLNKKFVGSLGLLDLSSILSKVELTWKDHFSVSKNWKSVFLK